MMPHHARAAGWTARGSLYWFHRCDDQCGRWRLVGWYYEVYPPLHSKGWWWACADCLVNIISDRLEEQKQ